MAVPRETTAAATPEIGGTLFLLLPLNRCTALEGEAKSV